jgi:single-strand DNA-binding protein
MLNNKAVCEFSLAVNRIGTDQADFITCQVWGLQAENFCKYQDKGNQVSVLGALRTDTYEVEGQKRYKTFVLAHNIEYLERKKSNTSENNLVEINEVEIVESKDDPFADFGESVAFDDGFLD